MYILPTSCRGAFAHLYSLLPGVHIWHLPRSPARVYIVPLSCRGVNLLEICTPAPWPSRPCYGHSMAAIDGACTKYSSRLKSVIVQQLIFFIVLTVLPWVQFLTFNHHLVQVRPPRCRALRRTTTRRAQTPTSSGRIRSTLQQSRRTQPD